MWIIVRNWLYRFYSGYLLISPYYLCVLNGEAKISIGFELRLFNLGDWANDRGSYWYYLSSMVVGFKVFVFYFYDLSICSLRKCRPLSFHSTGLETLASLIIRCKVCYTNTMETISNLNVISFKRFHSNYN